MFEKIPKSRADFDYQEFTHPIKDEIQIPLDGREFSSNWLSKLNARLQDNGHEYMTLVGTAYWYQPRLNEATEFVPPHHYIKNIYRLDGHKVAIGGIAAKAAITTIHNSDQEKHSVPGLYIAKPTIHIKNEHVSKPLLLPSTHYDNYAIVPFTEIGTVLKLVPKK